MSASPEAKSCCHGHRAPAPRAEAPPGVLHTCPMHPEVRAAGPGSCPLCGMALEPVETEADPAESPELGDFTRRLRIGAALTVPLVVLAMFGMGLPAWSVAAQWLLSTPVVLWAGGPLLQRGWVSVRTRRLNMFTLIALGTGVAYGFSVLAVLFPDLFPEAFRDHAGRVPVYFESAAVIITLVLLGQVLELRARHRTGSAIRALLRLAPATARRVRPDGEEEDVPLASVHVGDRLRVRPGEAVPVDGIVRSGSGSLDESMLTGEWMPAGKTPGDRVTAGTTNRSGSFVLEAKSVGRDTLLAQIVRFVSEAQRSRAPIQRLVDVIAAAFVPAVIGVALLTAVLWAVFGPEPRMAHALVNAVAVLIIACPCALGLATPMSILVAAGRGAREGVLLRNAEALEGLRRVDTFVFDKTGTLTEGKPSLLTVRTAGGFPEPEALELAAALEKGSEHPLAAAMLAGVRSRGVTAIPDTDEFRTVAGEGVVGRVRGRRIALGNERLLATEGVDTSSLAAAADALRAEAQTVLFLAVDGALAALFGVADPIKDSALQALEALRRDGLRLVMLTGDHPDTASAVASKLRIDEIFAGVLPDGKRALVARLRAQGHRVAMAGDGVNDAPALAEADVGIAMGTGTEIAMQSAGIVLVKGDLRGVVRALALSRATMRNIRQNLFFAFGYNALGIPLAAGALYPFFGILLSPMIASAAMSLSSVSVIANALRLRTVTAPSRRRETAPSAAAPPASRS